MEEMVGADMANSLTDLSMMGACCLARGSRDCVILDKQLKERHAS